MGCVVFAGIAIEERPLKRRRAQLLLPSQAQAIDSIDVSRQSCRPLQTKGFASGVSITAA